VVDGGRRWQQLWLHEPGKVVAFRDVYMCTERINTSMSINTITKAKTSTIWSGKTLWCSGHVEGAHGGTVIADGEDGVTRLNRQKRGGSGGFNRDVGLWRTRWQMKVENGGVWRTNWSSSSDGGGGCKRGKEKETMLWCLRGGRRVANSFETASSCFQLWWRAAAWLHVHERR
jgi:hypothetical protein